MNLALQAGEADWQAFGDRLPDEILQGWLEYYRREPFGADHLYEFLSHSFTLICQAFHSRDFAFSLTKQHFAWWRSEQTVDEEDLDLTDDELERQVEHLARAVGA